MKSPTPLNHASTGEEAAGLSPSKQAVKARLRLLAASSAHIIQGNFYRHQEWWILE